MKSDFVGQSVPTNLCHCQQWDCEACTWWLDDED